MIINGFYIKQDINGHDCIKIVNLDRYDEKAWDKYWNDLIFSIKDIISDYEKTEKMFEEIYDFFVIETLYGEIKIFSDFLEYDLLIADNNNDLIQKIANLLEKSKFFSKL